MNDMFFYELIDYDFFEYQTIEIIICLKDNQKSYMKTSKQMANHNFYPRDEFLKNIDAYGPYNRISLADVRTICETNYLIISYL